MRMLFAAYQNAGARELQLQHAFSSTVSESRRTEFEQLAGKSRLSVDEIDRLRESVQLAIASRIRPPVLLKTHNARVQHNGFPVIRRELTLGAIYIVRNPLDVVDSLADRMGESIDQAIDRMRNPNFTIGGPHSDLVTQYLDTWSNHVNSWVFQRAFPVHVVRYEDLLGATELCFRNVLTFLGWDTDSRRIEHAASQTAFANLQRNEASGGFQETSKQSKSGRFFRRGRAGQWPSVLSREQATRVVEDHREVLTRLGYQIPDLAKIYEHAAEPT